MYQWTVCDPLNESIINKGAIDKSQILETFNTFPWSEMLEKMESVDSSEIYFSPSLEFKVDSHSRGMTFSAVGKPDDFIFYIFYQRPEKIKKWFGFVEKEEPKFVSDIVDQSFEASTEVLKEFLAQKYEEVRSRFV